MRGSRLGIEGLGVVVSRVDWWMVSAIDRAKRLMIEENWPGRSANSRDNQCGNFTHSKPLERTWLFSPGRCQQNSCDAGGKLYLHWLSTYYCRFERYGTMPYPAGNKHSVRRRLEKGNVLRCWSCTLVHGLCTVEFSWAKPRKIVRLPRPKDNGIVASGEDIGLREKMDD